VSGGLGSVLGGGLGGGCGGLGPLGGLFIRRGDRMGFLDPASASASLEASESRSVIAAVVVVSAVVARSSADWRASSRDVRADALLATAAAAATRATTICISN
jgi:hypothetical protein